VPPPDSAPAATSAFLGECRAPAANLSVVRADLRPPLGSQFGWKGAELDLRNSVLNDFTPRPLSIDPRRHPRGGR